VIATTGVLHDERARPLRSARRRSAQREGSFNARARPRRSARAAARSAKARSMNNAAGLHGARHAITAARRVAATRGAALPALAWDDLVEWPSWALDDDAEALDTPARRMAALWYANALRRCIDGRCLQRAGTLVGEALLRELVAAPPTDDGDEAGAAALPALDGFDDAWRDAGRALLLATVERPALRELVVAQLGDDGHGAWPPAAAMAPARAQQWLARALALAAPSSPPAPPSPAPPSPAAAAKDSP
jgi:hypothetical protein